MEDGVSPWFMIREELPRLLNRLWYFSNLNVGVRGNDSDKGVSFPLTEGLWGFPYLVPRIQWGFPLEVNTCCLMNKDPSSLHTSRIKIIGRDYVMCIIIILQIN